MAATMKALVKARREAGLWLEDVPVPEIGINDVLIRVLPDGHLRHRSPHLQLGRLGAEDDPGADGGRATSSSGAVEAVGLERHRLQAGRPRRAARGTSSAAAAATAWPAAATSARTPRGSASTGRAPSPSYVCIPMTNVWGADPQIPLDVLAFFDPLGNAVHTALSFDVLGEDVLITGAGPIGLMAAAVVRHAGARHVVVTDRNPYRLDLARQMGATVAVDIRETPLADVQKQLGMKEGFDVGLEMSGNESALRDMLAEHVPRRQDRLLGIPERPTPIDWNTRDLQHAHAQGHLRPRDVRDLVQDDGHDPERASTSRPSSRTASRSNVTRTASAALRAGEASKVVLTWAEDA